MEVFKVSSKTDVKKLASAIYYELKKNGGKVFLRAVGAGAVNQAVKGIAIARGIAAAMGEDLRMIPGLETVEMKDGIKKTGIKFCVFR